MYKGLGLLLSLLLATPASAFTKSSLIGFSHVDASGAGGSTQYHPCAQSGPSTNSVYSDLSFDYRGAGATVQNMTVYIGTNAKTTASTLRLYKNGADASPSCTLTETLDDQFISGSGTASLTSGDTIVYKLLLGSGGGTVEIRNPVAELLTTSGPTVYLMQTAGDTSIGSSTNGYIPVGGSIGSPAATDPAVSFRVRSPGWLKYLQATLDNTIASGAITITLTKNTVDTAATVSVGTNQTAIDTTHPVRLASGDTISLHVVSGTLSSSVDLEQVSFLVESDNYQSDIILSGSKTYSAATATHYGQIFGGNLSGWSTTDAKNKLKIPFATTIGRLRVYSDQTTSGTGTLTLRVNGSNSALTLPIAATTAGWHETPIGLSVAVSANDQLDFVFDHSGFTGRFKTVGLTLNYDPSGGGAFTQAIQ